MSTAPENDFLQKYQIEFPELSALAVIHAEPVSLIPRVTYTLSEFGRDLLSGLIVERDVTSDQFLKSVASDKNAPNYSVIFFFDGPYYMAQHIYAVRSSIEEIAMLNCCKRGPHNSEVPLIVSALFVADVPTLTELATRSPYLGMLLPVADGPTDDAIWIYFLGRGETNEEVAEESINIPVKRPSIIMGKQTYTDRNLLLKRIDL